MAAEQQNPECPFQCGISFAAHRAAESRKPECPFGIRFTALRAANSQKRDKVCRPAGSINQKIRSAAHMAANGQKPERSFQGEGTEDTEE